MAIFILLAACVALAFFFRRPYTGKRASLPTVQEQRYQFIVAFCDGNERQARRLVEERQLQHPDISTDLIVSMVYRELQYMCQDIRSSSYMR